MDTEDRDHFKTIHAASAALLAASPRPPSAGSSPSGLDPAYCLNRTKILFSCYRKDEAHDPDTYCAAVAATLGDFPRQVVDYVTDPRTGLPSESRFLPNIAEVRAACVNEAERRRRLAQPKVTLRRDYPPVVKMAPGTTYDEMLKANGRIVGPFERVDDEWNGGRGVRPAGSAQT